MTWTLWRCRDCSVVRAVFTDEEPKAPCPACDFDGEPTPYERVPIEDGITVEMDGREIAERARRPMSR